MATNWIELIQQCNQYTVSKEDGSEDRIKRIYGEEPKNAGDHWLISARSKVYPPATEEEISAVETLFQAQLPADYKDFLRQTNGADVLIHRNHDGELCECQLFSTEKIIERADYFLDSAAGIFEEVQTPPQLQYVPIVGFSFGGGRYLVLPTHPDFLNQILLMWYESTYAPFVYLSAGDPFFTNHSLTISFSNWFEKLLKTYGAWGLEETFYTAR
jgi:hypothetical protein